MDRCFICGNTLREGMKLIKHLALKHMESRPHPLAPSIIVRYCCVCGISCGSSLYTAQVFMEQHLHTIKDLQAHYLEGVMNKIAGVGGE